MKNKTLHDLIEEKISAYIENNGADIDLTENDYYVPLFETMQSLVKESFDAVKLEKRHDEIEMGLTGEKEDFTAYHIFEESGLPRNYWNNTPEKVWATVYNLCLDQIQSRMKEVLGE